MINDPCWPPPSPSKVIIITFFFEAFPKQEFIKCTLLRHCALLLLDKIIADVQQLNWKTDNLTNKKDNSSFEHIIDLFLNKLQWKTDLVSCIVHGRFDLFINMESWQSRNDKWQRFCRSNFTDDLFYNEQCEDIIKCRYLPM